MSFDLKIEHVCTHLVVDEVLTVDLDDLRTIRTLRPIANNQVELKVNGYLVEDPTDSLNGFVLVRDTFSVDPTARLLRFKKLRRATDDFFEVSYYTSASNCRRCHGLRKENDYRYDLNGDIVTVEDEEKLIQDIKKIVITQIGTNQFHTWYGTSIVSFVGGKIANSSLVRTKLMGEIRTAVTRYANIQQQQARMQEVTAKERFVRLLNLEVSQDAIEPTAFSIALAFSNQQRATIVADTSVRVPDPVALAYNTSSATLKNR